MPLYKCKKGGEWYYTRNPGDCDEPVEILDEASLVKISKLMSRILRHEPRRFNVSIDSGGWVSIRDLTRSIQEVLGDDIYVGDDVIAGIAATDPKSRFQLKGSRIRAIYGHSIEVDIDYPESNPKVLYHGTQLEKLNSILRRGLLPGRRLYVHLSPTPSDACTVARRRKGTPIYLVINTEKVRGSGLTIYRATPRVFLVKKVPPEAIESYKYCGALQR
ncbi:MAG: RNA 2'-phosphotransferase [Desulfurococcales archaeon]|nr:RNA 2'-phosphotransferase [Desulfurococcales archaeon]